MLHTLFVWMSQDQYDDTYSYIIMKCKEYRDEKLRPIKLQSICLLLFKFACFNEKYRTENYPMHDYN